MDDIASQLESALRQQWPEAAVEVERDEHPSQLWQISLIRHGMWVQIQGKGEQILGLADMARVKESSVLDPQTVEEALVLIGGLVAAHDLEQNPTERPSN
jgi:hypothetical protein